MARTSLNLFIRLLVIPMTLSLCHSSKYLRKSHRPNFSLLIDFTCATAEDELEKHPEMRTIAMVELENNFPSEFSREILKCLPTDVAKIIINPHDDGYEDTTKNLPTNVSLNENFKPREHEVKRVTLPKQSMIIYLLEADEWSVSSFHHFHHLSKHLIVTSDKRKVNESSKMLSNLLNAVQIFEQNRKVIAKIFDMTRNLTTFETFESSQQENLSQILFPDKAKNLNGQDLHSTFNFFLDILVERLNATLSFTNVDNVQVEEFDFHLSYPARHDLQSYNNLDWCFLAPLPNKISITDQILFLPMDKSCWMWLGITIAVSTLIWRISEGHWNFAFGAFSYGVGQFITIRTTRFILKILLQIWILTLFIFSNGYQSIVTSFMLEPLKVPLLKTINDVLDSDFKIEAIQAFDQLQQDNLKYKKAARDERFVDCDEILSHENWTSVMIEQKVVSQMSCAMAKMRLEYEGDGTSFDGIYVIQEVIYSQQQDIYTSPFHPYIESFQKLMDRSFEAGLHQAWERFFWEIFRELKFRLKEHEEDDELLDFSLIAPFFFILLYGFGAALLILFCEIFCNDFITQLTKEYFKRKWKEFFGKDK